MSISLFRAIAGQYQNLRTVNTVTMMNVISHEIEDQVINQQMPVDFYAGFQRFSNFPQQLRRYSRLGAVCRRVYVFGVPDVRPPVIPGIEFIELDPTSALAREWFVLVDTSDFWTILAAQEMGGRDQVMGGRRFDGVWSYDTTVVERASLLISQELADFYEPVATRHYDRQSAAIATISGNLIKSLEQSQIVNRRRWVQLCTLHTFAEAVLKGYTTPALLVNHCPGHLFEDIMQTLRTVFGAAAVSIALHDRNGGYATVAVEGDGSNGHQTLYPGEGPSGQAINQGRAILVPDTRRQQEQDTLLPAAASLIAAPIIGRRNKYGVIAVGGAEANQWNEEDTRTVQTLARMLAAVIEQNMELNQSQTQADAYTRNLEQAVQRLRQPVGYLLSLTQQLRDAGTLNSAQQETLTQFELLTGSLARVLGVSATATVTTVEAPEAEPQPVYERALGE